MFIQPPTPATPPVPTPAQTVAQLRIQGGLVLRQLNALAVQGIQAVWGTPSQPNTVAQAQAVVTVMGTDATSAFLQSAALVGLLADPAVNYPVDPAVLALIRPFTVNNDGTITINK